MTKKDADQLLETALEFAEFEDLNPDWADEIKARDGFSNVDVKAKVVIKGVERSIADCNSCLVGEGRS